MLIHHCCSHHPSTPATGNVSAGVFSRSGGAKKAMRAVFHACMKWRVGLVDDLYLCLLEMRAEMRNGGKMRRRRKGGGGGGSK